MNNVPSVVIAPSVLSGEVCLNNHKLPVALICEHVRTLGVEATMRDYDLDRSEVLTACWFYGAYGIKNIHRLGRFRKKPRYRLNQDETAIRKWRSWAENYSQALAAGEYDKIPDPPLARWHERKIRKQQKLAKQEESRETKNEDIVLV
jgi:uncharacterized protein (DUF433 family)